MICEMYIYDCTVFGDTNIEFLSRLKLIFGRFRKHNVYLKLLNAFSATLNLSLKRDYNILYENTVCTRLSVTHCEQTAEELFGHSELSQRLC